MIDTILEIPSREEGDYGHKKLVIGKTYPLQGVSSITYKEKGYQILSIHYDLDKDVQLVRVKENN